MFFFFKQKTAYEMRISDWSSDVCSSDLIDPVIIAFDRQRKAIRRREAQRRVDRIGVEAIGVLVEQRVGQETILLTVRSEERRVGKSVSVRVDLGGRRLIKKKTHNTRETYDR